MILKGLTSSLFCRHVCRLLSKPKLAEHLLRDDIRRDKTAAEKHDEEAEEVEEIAVFEIRTVERVGIQDANQGAQNRTDAGNEDAVEE